MSISLQYAKFKQKYAKSTPHEDFITLDPPPSEAESAAVELLLVSEPDGGEPLHVPIAKKFKTSEPILGAVPDAQDQRLLTSLEHYSFWLLSSIYDSHVTENFLSGR